MNASMGFDPAQFSILFPIGGVDFNILELLIWAAFICGVAFFWRKAATSWSTYFGALAIVAGVAFVTVIETTQFMTLDEAVITTALLDPTSRAANQLHSGALKVGMLGALPATIALQSLGLDGISIKMALKALWWLAGNLALVVMAWTVVRLAKPEPKPAPLATAATYAALAMLPTAQLAIKTVNYDLVSSIAGATSLFLLMSYLWTGAPRAGWAAFALAILAASEKLTAGAILIAAIAALALRPLLEEPSAWVRARRAAARGIAILALFALASAFILLLLSFLLPASGQRGFWRLLLDPISTWIWFPVLRFVTIETVLEYRVAIGIAACCLPARRHHHRRLYFAKGDCYGESHGTQTGTRHAIAAGCVCDNGVCRNCGLGDRSTILGAIPSSCNSRNLFAVAQRRCAACRRDNGLGPSHRHTRLCGHRAVHRRADAHLDRGLGRKRAAVRPRSNRTG